MIDVKRKQRRPKIWTIEPWKKKNNQKNKN